MAYKHEEKSSGQLIRSIEWNTMGHELERLETDKVNRAGDTIRGELKVTGKFTGADGRFESSLSVGGNVGIGTTPTTERLEVAGNIKINGARLKNSAGYAVVQTDATDWLRINPDSQYPAIALYKPVAIGEGGLAVGEWAQLPKGDLKVTGASTFLGAGTFGQALTVKGLLTTGAVNLGGFTPEDKDEWPQLTWLRDGNTNWDEGLIKHSAARGKFKRAGFGIHLNQSREFNLISTGWDMLFAVEGGSGNTFIKGRLNIENGVIQRGGTTITNTSDLGLYSHVDGNWIRIVSTKGPVRFYTDGGIGTNQALSINSNNTIDAAGDLSVAGKLAVTGNVTLGNSDIYFSKTDHNHTGTGNTEGWAAIENAQNYDALMILGRTQKGGKRVVKLWDYLEVNGEFRVTGDQNIFKVFTETRAVKNSAKNTPATWTVNYSGFSQVYTAYVILQGFSLWGNNNNLQFNSWGQVAGDGAIPQHVFARITDFNTTRATGQSFCSESGGGDDDNTVLFTLVVIGRGT